MLSSRQAWIAVGVAAAVLAFGYLATQREVHATVTAGEASIEYRSSEGAAGAPTAQEDSHARMMRLIEESSAVLEANP
jgi:hypothetical protein